jgi:hypothetical protein
MLFNSFPFLLVFLPIAILLSRLVDPYPQWRVGMLLLLSLVFYGYWNPPFIVLLVLSIAVNWLAARAYVVTGRKIILTTAIIGDIAVLAVFKYANFLSYNFGLVLDRPTPRFDIVLPLGISFFTFHHIMYLVDLRRGKAPSYSLDRYALYISFFPQSIAGPLARWSEVMHQFGGRIYAPGWQQRFMTGAMFIVTGLIEKVEIGDRLGRLLDPVYAQAQLGQLPDGLSWLAFCFGFQIFFDFAGYSDVAVGLGLLFGVRLPYNFDAPFRSINIQEFWQRWHITLMMFLRDYVFLPLANARAVPRRFRLLQYFGAMLLTMALCGLWHGPSWTFVLWGVLHGCALVTYSLWRRYCPRLPAAIGWALTVLFVLATAVIFRAGDLDSAWHVFRGLTVAPGFDRVRHLLPIPVAVVVAFLSPASQDVIARLTVTPRPWLAGLLGLAVLALLLDLGDQKVYEFVYFHF